MHKQGGAMHTSVPPGPVSHLGGVSNSPQTPEQGANPGTVPSNTALPPGVPPVAR